MRILVSGGTGFIGAHLCSRLAAEHHQVFVLTRALTRGHGLLRWTGNPQVSLVAGDLIDHPAIRSEVAKCRPEIVFHLASMRMEDAPGGDGRLILRANSEGTYNLLDACAALPTLPRVIYTSSMCVYNYAAPSYLPVDEAHPAKPADVYGLSELMAELTCQFFSSNKGLSCNILRLSGVFGPGKSKGVVYNCLNSALTDSVVRLHGNGIRRDFLWVTDSVEALVLAMAAGRPGECGVYNIGSGVASSPADVAHVVERVARRRVRKEVLEDTPASEFRYDIRKAQEELGFYPHPLEEGVARYWQSLTDGKDSPQ